MMPAVCFFLPYQQGHTIFAHVAVYMQSSESGLKEKQIDKISKTAQNKV
jgi:hypothetical protein